MEPNLPTYQSESFNMLILMYRYCNTQTPNINQQLNIFIFVVERRAKNSYVP